MFVSLYLVWLWTGLTVCSFLALFSVLVMFICFFLFSWFVCSYSSAPLTVIWFICLFLSWLLVIMFACLFVFFFGLYAGVLQRPVTVDRSDCLLTRLLTQYRATLPPSSCVSSCEKRSDFQNHHLLQPVSTYPVIVTQQVELARLTCTQSSHAARSAAGRQLDKWPQWGGDERPE